MGFVGRVRRGCRDGTRVLMTKEDSGMRMNIRVGTYGVSSKGARLYGKISASDRNKTASNRGVDAPDLRPKPDTYLGGEGSVTNRTKVRSEERRLIALEYLQRAADSLSSAAVARIRYIALAREYDATWRDIATSLGLSETGARRLYDRNADILNGGDE